MGAVGGSKPLPQDVEGVLHRPSAQVQALCDSGLGPPLRQALEAGVASVLLMGLFTACGSSAPTPTRTVADPTPTQAAAEATPTQPAEPTPTVETKEPWEIRLEETIAAAQEEGEITIVCRKPPQWGPWVAKFQEKYGITVNLDSAGSSQAQRLAT